MAQPPRTCTDGDYEERKKNTRCSEYSLRVVRTGKEAGTELPFAALAAWATRRVSYFGRKRAQRWDKAAALNWSERAPTISTQRMVTEDDAPITSRIYAGI